MKNILNVGKRKEIFALIKKHPGLNLSKIAEKLDMRISLVEYHLSYLERYDFITSIKDDWFKHYYIKDEISSFDRKVINFLQKEKYFKIISLIQKNPNSTHGEILKDVDISRSTLSYYLNKLLKKGIIKESNKKGEHKRYTIFDEKEMVRIINKYGPFTDNDGSNVI